MREFHEWKLCRAFSVPVLGGVGTCASRHRLGTVIHPGGHCEGAADGVLSKNFPPPGVMEGRAQWLQTENESNVVCANTASSGRPCGGTQFPDQVENILGLFLHARKRGR